MVINLPWFIWREIIDYTVLLSSEYCLVNKEWFAYSSGRFIKLDFYHFRNNNTPPESYKKAEELELRSYNLNWAFLNECNNLKKIVLEVDRGFKIMFKNVEGLFRNCRIESVTFKSLHESYQSHCVHLLGLINKTVREINLESYNLDLGDSFLLEFPKAYKFKSYTRSTTYSFTKIQETMPRIQSLSLNIFKFTFDKSVSDNCTFRYLVFLELEADRLYGDEIINYSDMFDNIFSFNFPSLTILFVFVPSFGKASNKMIQAIPGIKQLKIYSDLCEEYRHLFLNHSLPLLEDLEIRDRSKSNSNWNLLKFDLNNFPKLHKAKLWCKFDFINSNPSHEPEIEVLEFIQTDCFPYKTIGSYLPKLSELEMYTGGPESGKENYFFELTKIASKLTISSINKTIPRELMIPGPYKTTHLNLEGYSFINNYLLQWLADQPQLTHLRLEMYLPYGLNLKPIHFPYLKQLTIICSSAKNQSYLKKMISFGERKQKKVASKKITTTKLSSADSIKQDFVKEDQVIPRRSTRNPSKQASNAFKTENACTEFSLASKKRSNLSEKPSEHAPKRKQLR